MALHRYLVIDSTTNYRWTYETDRYYGYRRGTMIPIMDGFGNTIRYDKLEQYETGNCYALSETELAKVKEEKKERRKVA